MIEIVSQGLKETQKAASFLAKEAAKAPRQSALVIALEGELGSGKTAFSQGFARSLGVKEKVLSPTFVLLKIYNVKRKGLKHLVHIDCYRLDSPEELLHLGFKDLLQDKDAVILIEWADRVKKFIPKNAVWILFSHLDKTKRVIRIS